jgi:hypothetical protein
MNKDISSIRKDYQLASLDEETTAALPMDQFGTLVGGCDCKWY